MAWGRACLGGTTMADNGTRGGWEDCIYSKTDAGRTEIQTRANKLSPALRSILLLVDGQRDATTLRRTAANLRAPTNALEQLAALGLIRNVHALAETAVARPSSMV